jgi:hypothetical protein
VLSIHLWLPFEKKEEKKVKNCLLRFFTVKPAKCLLLLAKAAALRVTLNLDGAPIASNSHTHPSHSQTSRLLTLSLSLGVPVPRPTQQCMRDT